MFGDTDIGWDHEVTIGKKKFLSGDIRNRLPSLISELLRGSILIWVGLGP